MRLGGTLRTKFDIDVINYYIDMGAPEVPPEAAGVNRQHT